jgi:uncharacterized protein with NAD-binding domain and iron-sulfur cluster
MSNVKKVAVLGGGMSSLTTVLELTSEKNWQTNYDITLYQLGWRLGGKGASGRNPHIHQRIEEHGLHLWFGFYDNAFDLIKKCYNENNRELGKPLAKWQEAFKPYNFIVLEDKVKDNWEHWAFKFPQNDQEPGSYPNEAPLTVAGYVRRILRFVYDMYKTYNSDYGLEPETNFPDKHKGFLNKLLDELKDVVEVFLLETGSELILKAIEEIEEYSENHNTKHHDKVLHLIDLFLKWLENKIEDKVGDDPKLRRLWISIDFALSNVRGMLRDGVLIHGFDVINNYDYREWLQKHGATQVTIDSGVVQGVYGLVFGGYKYYTFEAGTALRGALRMMFTYRGSIYYRMQAGMGDVIFAPIYEVLHKRGVKFKFFHKVTNLKLSPDKKYIQSVEMNKQVNLKNEEYHPLINVKDLPCWSSEPSYDQLVEGDILKEKGIDLESYYSEWAGVENLSLEYGKDFDILVQGISIGALPHIAKEIIASNPKWADMVKNVTACPTQAFQLWLKPDVAGLGWPFWVQDMALLGSYQEPYDTWADMSDLIIREDWKNGYYPNNIAYFCGPMMDVKLAPFSEHNFPDKMTEEAKKNALDYMKNLTAHIWENSHQTNTGDFDWNLLIDVTNKTGEQRFDSQFFRSNIQPSELYVLSETNSTKYRLKTDDSGYANMYITGDWIFNGFNAGCIEASVISGMQTARAITKQHYQIHGETDLV